MVANAGQAILHASVAAVIVEALLRVWRVEDPGERLALRWVALLSPLLAIVFRLAAPFRSSERFGSTWALLAGSQWDELRVGGVGLGLVATLALSAVGLVLYLRDVIPFLDDRIRGRAGDRALPDTHPGRQRIGRALRAVRPAIGPVEPAIVLMDRATPVLLCSGIDLPVIVVSTGTLDRLDDDELRAALAHEASHLAHRDPLTGWVLLVVRTALAFNPATQVVARQVVQDVEYRADVAVAGIGESKALARAIARLSADDESQTNLLPASRRPRLHARVAELARKRAVGDRCQRVLEHAVSPDVALMPLRVGLAGVGVAAILFFIV